MTKPLKVYAWTGMGAGAMGQVRCIMAASSVAEVLRQTGLTRADWHHSGDETMNDEELAIALAEPGVKFSQSIYARPGEFWHRADGTITMHDPVDPAGTQDAITRVIREAEHRGRQQATESARKQWEQVMAGLANIADPSHVALIIENWTTADSVGRSMIESGLQVRAAERND